MDRAEEIGLTLQHCAGVPLVWVEHADGQAKALSRRLAHFFDGALRSDPRQHRAALIDHALDICVGEAVELFAVDISAFAFACANVFRMIIRTSHCAAPALRK